MLVEAKQGDKAADHLRKALDGTKDDAPMLGTLGRLLAFSKAYGDCVKALDRAIKVYLEYRRLAGDARKRGRIASALYKGV